MRRIAPGVASLSLAILAACGGGAVSGPGRDLSAENDVPREPGPDLDDVVGPDEEGGADLAVPDEAASPVPDLAEAEDGRPPPPCTHGEMCDDHDPCTYADQCKYGVCEGTPYACSDGSACTHDLCDGAGGCRYPLREDRCLIGGACYQDADANPANPCEACVPTVSNVAWTPADGLPCDDQDYCTVSDTCLAGVCRGPLPNPCDDHNFCTDDSCDPTKGCVHVPTTRACDDGNPCTVGDACLNGTCRPGSLIVYCDDHNPCTDDACVPGVGCVHEPNDHPCDDDDVCTIGDRCADGLCAPGSETLPCADTNPCTDDLCHPRLGCQHVPNEAPCDDANPCTDGDRCAYGLCLAGPGLPNCQDGNPCTADYCDPAAGGCAYAPQAGPCDDGNPCTLGDFCEAGTCKAGGVPVDCEDHNPCTLDTCGPAGDCLYVPLDLPCDDGDPCTLGDRCVDSACVPGGTPLACQDANPCTADACAPGEGCFHEPVANTCSDGNACTVGDRCLNGVCVPGDQVFACDDGNPCTADVCDPAKGCVFQPLDGTPCDDGQVCTSGDHCEAGACTGSQSPCDDGNACTQDLCLPGGGCDHALLDTPACKPLIEVFYPPRGAMIKGPPDVITVTGRVTSEGGPITQFLVNDSPVSLKADGTFSRSLPTRSGINILRLAATNAAGGMVTGVRAFAFSHHFYPTDPSNPKAAEIPDGLRVYLGPTVFDDNDPTTQDDFATLILLMLKGMDLAALIPDPLAQTQILQCQATIRAKNIQFKGPDLDLVPINGGLRARVRLTNISLDIQAQMSGFLCPSASGKVQAQGITVEADLLVSVPKPGQVKVLLANEKATITGLDITLDGLLGFLFNWLVDLFEGTITAQLEQMVVAQLAQFAPLLEDALESLAIEQTLTIPPLIGSGKPVPVTLRAVLSSARFDTSGADIGLTATALAPKAIPYQPLGSLARSACLLPSEPPFHFIEMNELEFALFDDLVNQVLYSVWYGGALEITLGEADLPPGTPLDQYGVANLVLDVSFLLPPVLTSCTPMEKFKAQVGDVHVHASMTLMGQPIEMDAYASAEAELLIDVQNTPAGAELAFGIQNIDIIEIEVESVSGGMAGAKYALAALIEDTLLPMLFEGFTGGPIASFPIPEIDLGSLGTGLPQGTTFSLEARQIYRNLGHTVVSGIVK